MRDIILFCLLVMFTCLFFGCNTKNEVCETLIDDKLQVKFVQYINQTYPDVPYPYLVEGEPVTAELYVERLSQQSSPQVYNYTVDNIRYSINGQMLNDFEAQITENPGNISVALQVDCTYFEDHPKKSKQVECDCPLNMYSASEDIIVLAKKQLLLKKITYTRQFHLTEIWDLFPSTYPDVYLEITNSFLQPGITSIKSPVMHEYNLEETGPKIWEAKETITIPEKHFNLKMKVWDFDTNTSDDLIGDYTFPAEDANHWETGTYVFSVQNGSIEIEVERLD